MIGKSISHYKIVEEIGRGGMGVVYRAHDTTLDRDVALKFLPPHLLENEESKKRFHNEAKAASALDHPNICTIFEFGEFQNQSYIAMALVEGESLETRLAKGPLSVKQTIELAKQVVRGLAAAHKKGIVHRDLKPANIMTDQNGIVKIMDFGLARREEHTQVTQSGSTLGTLSYMSPEQVRGEIVDARSDLWSLGVILIEVLTGNRPFTGDYDAAILFKILNEDASGMAAIRNISNPLFSLIEGLLEKDREVRTEDANSFLNKLNKIQPEELTLTIVDIPDQKRPISKESLTSRFIREIRRRKFIPIVGSYLMVSIGLFEVGPYFIDQYKFDPRWHQVILICILSGFPIAGIIAYFHGRKGPDKLRGVEVLLYASVIVLASAFSVLSWQSAPGMPAKLAQTQSKTEAETEALNKIRQEVVEIRTEMLVEKTAADKIDANIKANVYYDDAIQQEIVGNEKMTAGGKESLRAAKMAFTMAKDGYQKARDEAASSVNIERPAKPNIESRVVQMRSDMMDIKTQLPGSQTDKKRNNQYQQAIAREEKGDGEFDAKDFNAALFSFENAKMLYAEAKVNILATLKDNANNAKTSMNAAKENVQQNDFTNAKYQKAIQFETDGNTAYSQNDFNAAASHFKDAELNFGQVVTEAALMEKEKTDSERERISIIEQGVKSVIDKFKGSLEKKNIEGVRSLFTNLIQSERDKWRKTFRRINIQRVQIAQESIKFGENSATVDILMRIFYIDNKNRRRPPISYAYTWTVEEINGKWMISSFQSR